MEKIFCLETEWNQTKHDLKNKSTALSLLEFFENCKEVNFIYRQVATASDFNYYINHLYYDCYNAYTTIYLCFHGSNSNIHFANDESCNILDFARENQNIFYHRNVHFGSCSTLKIPEEYIKDLKRLTGARMVTGYTKDVDFVDSFVFEMELLYAICSHPDYAEKRLEKYMDDRMSFYVNKFGFISR